MGAHERASKEAPLSLSKKMRAGKEKTGAHFGGGVSWEVDAHNLACARMGVKR